MKDGNARCSMGPKHGAPKVEPLFRAAQTVGICVSSVSFHIRSGDTNCHAYRGATAPTKDFLNMNARLEMPKIKLFYIMGRDT